MRQLQFRNNSQVYEIDDNWVFDVAPYTRRLDLSSRYSRNGSNVYGDRTTDARAISFRRQLPTQDDQLHINFLVELEQFFDVVNFPFFLEDLQNNRRCSIEVDRIGTRANSDGLRMRLENVELGVVMLDGEWEDLTENVVSATLSTGNQLTVTNNGRLVFAVVEVESQDNILDFQILNTSNSSGLTMSLTSFQTGEKIILDGRNGRIAKDGVDQSFNVVEGGLISLQSGANIIRYASATGSSIVTVKWRNVYGN